MVKVQYNGDISPGRVRVWGSIYHFVTGQIQDLDERSAAKLTLNSDYVIVAEEPETSYRKSRKKVEKEKELEEGDE